MLGEGKLRGQPIRDLISDRLWIYPRSCSRGVFSKPAPLTLCRGCRYGGSDGLIPRIEGATVFAWVNDYVANTVMLVPKSLLTYYVLHYDAVLLRSHAEALQCGGI